MSSTVTVANEPERELRVYVPEKHKPFRWSLKDYQKLWDVDLFHDMRMILIDGVIYKKPTPTPKACYSIQAINDWLRPNCFDGHHNRTQAEIEIDDWNCLVPWHSVVKGGLRDYAMAHPTSAAWVIEVSEASLAFDTTTLAELYAKAKVPDYWVLDIVQRRMIVFRDPESNPTGMGATAYRTHLVFHENDIVAPTIDSNYSKLVSGFLA